GRINEQLETELKHAGQHAKIPGFRPGNIPMKVLKQRYGKNVQGDVLKNVIGKSTGEVLTERKLRPAMTPDINIEKYEEEGDLVYTMSFEIFPDVKDIAFEKITLDRNTFEIE